jgi:hypothetical protein
MCDTAHQRRGFMQPWRNCASCANALSWWTVSRSSRRHSSFGTSRLDLERRCRNLARICMYRNIHTQTRKRTAYNSARKVEILSNHVCQQNHIPSDLSPKERPISQTKTWMPVKTHRLRPTQRLLRCFHARFPVYAHATQRLEARVCENEDASVVRFQVIYLFAEKERPEVFADEFDAVEGRLRAGAVGAESVGGEYRSQIM